MKTIRSRGSAKKPTPVTRKPPSHDGVLEWMEKKRREILQEVPGIEAVLSQVLGEDEMGVITNRSELELLEDRVAQQFLVQRVVELDIEEKKLPENTYRKQLLEMLNQVPGSVEEDNKKTASQVVEAMRQQVNNMTPQYTGAGFKGTDDEGKAEAIKPKFSEVLRLASGERHLRLGNTMKTEKILEPAERALVLERLAAKVVEKDSAPQKARNRYLKTLANLAQQKEDFDSVDPRDMHRYGYGAEAIARKVEGAIDGGLNQDRSIV